MNIYLCSQLNAYYVSTLNKEYEYMLMKAEQTCDFFNMLDGCAFE